MNDVAEFYIIPVMRRKGLGEYLAKSIFDQHPDLWECHQIDGADSATFFWRAVVGRYTDGQYEEQQVSDLKWECVTKQIFHAPAH